MNSKSGPKTLLSDVEEKVLENFVTSSVKWAAGEERQASVRKFPPH